MNNNPIGAFDSGVGGLSCIRALAGALPKEQIIYYGDTGNAPYGSRPESEIIELSLAVADKLIAMGCKSISIACNTVSCVAAAAIQKKYPDVPVIGIVKPAAKFVAENYKGRKVGLIATAATVRSEAYPRAIEEYGGGVSLSAKATPAFVPLIEAGKSESEDMMACIKENLDEFVFGLDALILGCTHYPFIRAQIHSLYPQLEIIDPAQALADMTKSVLKEKNILSDTKLADNKFISSSSNAFFDAIVKQLQSEI